MSTSPQAYVLDTNPELAAKYYNDKDVMEQPSTLIEVLRAANSDTHALRKHVLSKWASGRKEYGWLYNLAQALLNEQAYRFNHRDEELIESLHLLFRYRQDAEDTPSRFVQLTDVKIAGDAVQAYRAFYHRATTAPVWTKRGAPKWWKGNEQFSLNL